VNSPKGPNTIRIAGAVNIMVALIFVASFATLTTSFLPYMMPSAIAIAVAASPRSSLAFMFWAAGLFLFTRCFSTRPQSYCFQWRGQSNSRSLLERYGFTMSNLHGVSDHLHDNHSGLRCKRLLFRCWHRGTQESNLLLGRFAEAHLSKFDSAQLDQLEALLDCTNPGPFDRIIGGFAPPKEDDHDVMHLLCGFARHHNRKN
jgi:antitoxin CptB